MFELSWAAAERKEGNGKLSCLCWLGGEILSKDIQF